MCGATWRSRPYSTGTAANVCSSLSLTISNVLAIDYRGFADSTGTPSEAGLLTDAEAAWDFVMTRSGKGGAENIILVGQSLGTGVASGLAGKLADKGRSSRLPWMIN